MRVAKVLLVRFERTTFSLLVRCSAPKLKKHSMRVSPKSGYFNLWTTSAMMGTKGFASCFALENVRPGCECVSGHYAVAQFITLMVDCAAGSPLQALAPRPFIMSPRRAHFLPPSDHGALTPLVLLAPHSIHLQETSPIRYQVGILTKGCLERSRGQ